MTDNSKTPPAKKTIQDPPEYAAAALKKAPKGSLSGGSGDWLGGPQNGEEENHQGDWLGGPQNGAEAPGPRRVVRQARGKRRAKGQETPKPANELQGTPKRESSSRYCCDFAVSTTGAGASAVKGLSSILTSTWIEGSGLV